MLSLSLSHASERVSRLDSSVEDHLQARGVAFRVTPNLQEMVGPLYLRPRTFARSSDAGDAPSSTQFAGGCSTSPLLVAMLCMARALLPTGPLGSNYLLGGGSGAALLSFVRLLLSEEFHAYMRKACITRTKYTYCSTIERSAAGLVCMHSTMACTLYSYAYVACRTRCSARTATSSRISRSTAWRSPRRRFSCRGCTWASISGRSRRAPLRARAPTASSSRRTCRRSTAGRSSSTCTARSCACANVSAARYLFTCIHIHMQILEFIFNEHSHIHIVLVYGVCTCTVQRSPSRSRTWSRRASAARRRPPSSSSRRRARRSRSAPRCSTPRWTRRTSRVSTPPSCPGYEL